MPPTAGKPQVIPGIIGLVYSDLTGVISRLRKANRNALEGTAFAWKKESDDLVHVLCPYGEEGHSWPRADLHVITELAGTES